MENNTNDIGKDNVPNIPFEVTNKEENEEFDTKGDLEQSIDEGNTQVDDVQISETNIKETSQVSIGDVLSEVQALKNDFEAKLKYDAHIIAKAIKPILLDIIIIIDDNLALIKRNKEKMEGADSGDLKKVFSLWQGKVDDLTEVLNRSEVEVYECLEEEYVPSRQKAIKAIPTEDPKLDKKICERLKKGYEWEGKILRHEQVTVYKYKSVEEDK